MKVKSTQINSLSTQLNKGADAVLLYGTDEGELAHAFSQLKQQLKVSEKDLNAFCLTKEDFKQAPFLATDEANTPSLLMGRRFIFVGAEVPFTAEALTHFLTHKKTDALLIIQGGNLNKKSLLRAEAEKNPRVLAITCYAPKLADIQSFIRTYLFQNQKRISPEVLNELTQRISFNQQVIEKELEKLVIYMGGRAEVTVADIEATITLSAEGSLDDLCIHLADGNVAEVGRDVALFLASHTPETVLLAAVRGYFEKLLKIVSEPNPPAAVTQYLLPAQFGLEKPLARQSLIWKPLHILGLLNALSELEKNTRATGYDKETLVAEAFLNLATRAKRLAGLR